MRIARLAALVRWAVIAARVPALRGQRFLCGPGTEVHVEDGASVRIGRGLTVRRNFYGWFAGEIVIGREVFFNEGCHVVAMNSVRIGDGCAFGEKVSIHDENHRVSGDLLGARLSTRGLDTAPISIGDHVWVGAKATILAGVTIGDDAVVAAHAVVTRDVPARTMVGGVPARIIKTLEGAG